MTKTATGTALLTIAAIVAQFALAGAASAVSFTLEAAPGATPVGGTIITRGVMAGFTGGAGNSLSAFDVDLIYDPSMLSFSSVSFGDGTANPLDLPEVGALPFFGDITNLPGKLDLFGLSGNSTAVLDTLQPDAFVLFTLQFLALAPGVSTMGIDLLDPTLLFADTTLSNLFPLADSTYSAAIRVDAVPEPNVAQLLLAGAVALTRPIRIRALRRRRGLVANPAAVNGGGF